MREKADNGVCPFCGFDEAQYEPSPHHLPPRSILGGKCLIGRVLGEGGFGITYMGWDLNLDLKLAIKEYYPTGYVTRTGTSTNTVTPYRGEKTEFFTTGRARFINEAKTLAKFYTLPGIVSVRDFFLENGTAYIVMEFVEGETLKQRLSRVGGKMATGEVFDLMRPLLRSLAQMHASGLIHRDISPDNIMITPENNVKLIDFGAARDYLDSGNRSLSVMLKPGYAPEEQYFARGQQGPWTDIYALCATIYRAITGITPPESVERLRHDELKAPSELGVAISPAQEAALLRGLAVSQEDRWQTIPQLVGALYPFDSERYQPKSIHDDQKIPVLQDQAKNQKIDSDNPAPVPKSLFQQINERIERGIRAKTEQNSANEQNSNPDTAITAEHTVSEETPRQTHRLADKIARLWASKYRPALLALGVVAVLLIAFVGAVLVQSIQLFRIDQMIKSKDYYDARVLIKKIDADPAEYNESLDARVHYWLDKGNFEQARTYRDIMIETDKTDFSMLDDLIDFSEAKTLVENGNYAEAQRLIDGIENKDKFNFDTVYRGIYALAAQDCLDHGKFQEAAENLVALKKYDLELAQSIAEDHKESVYDFGVTQYRDGELSDAEAAFLLLPTSYLRTEDYLILISASHQKEDQTFYWDWIDQEDSAYLIAKQLIPIADFENAGELLLYSNDSAKLFLLGTWTNSIQYFEVEAKANEPGRFTISQNIPGIQMGPWSFSDGTLLVEDENGEDAAVAHFSIIDRNTILISVESSKILFKMYRS
jgi:serine/threonine protein kinase